MSQPLFPPCMVWETDFILENELKSASLILFVSVKKQLSSLASINVNHIKRKSRDSVTGTALCKQICSRKCCLVGDHMICLSGTTTRCRLTPTQVCVTRTTCPTSSSSAVWQAWLSTMGNCLMVSAAENIFINAVWNDSHSENDVIDPSWCLCLLSLKLSSSGPSTRWCCRSQSSSKTWSLLWVSNYWSSGLFSLG